MLLKDDRRARLGIGLLAAGAVAFALRVAVGHPGVVPGLAIVFPIGWLGLWAGLRADLATPGARAMAMVAGTVVAGVLATQYSIGGGLEWGGRYFAITLPLVVPLALVVLGRAIPRPSHCLAIGLAAVSSASLATVAVLSLRAGHEAAARQAAVMVTAGSRVSPGAASVGNGRPVVLTAQGLLPQLVWHRYDSFQWVTPETDLLGTYAHRLREAGVQRLLFVSADLARELPLVARDYTPTGPSPDRAPLPVFVLQAKQL